MVSVELIAIASAARPPIETGYDPGRMAGFGEEPYQIVARDGGGHGVPQRVKIEPRMRHHGGVEHHGDPPGGVVDRRERRHRAGLDAERLAHQVGRAEREAAVCAKRAVQRFQLDRGVLERAHQEQRALLVAQEQVLGVAARDLAAQRPRFLDREQRRVRHRCMGDAEPVEIGEQVVGGRGHGAGIGIGSSASYAGRRRQCKFRPQSGRSGRLGHCRSNGANTSFRRRARTAPGSAAVALPGAIWHSFARAAGSSRACRDTHSDAGVAQG